MRLVDEKGVPFNGIHKKLNINGDVASECMYVDGFKNGLFKSYYKDGQVSVACIFSSSVTHPTETYNGHFKSYNTEGQLKRYKFMVDGYACEESIGWHDNGQVKDHFCVRAGLRCGEAKKWKKDGTLYAHWLYDGSKIVDNLLVHEYNPNNRKEPLADEEKLMLAIAGDFSFLKKPTNWEYYEAIKWD